MKQIYQYYSFGQAYGQGDYSCGTYNVSATCSTSQGSNATVPPANSDRLGNSLVIVVLIAAALILGTILFGYWRRKRKNKNDSQDQDLL